MFHPHETPEAINTVDARGGDLKIPFLGYSWHEAFSGGTVPFDFHKQKHAKAGLGKKQLVNAWKAWNAVPKVIKWTTKGKKIKGPAPGKAARSGDASVMMQNGDPKNEISDASTTLAVGGAWFFSGPKIRKLGPAFSGFIINQDTAAAEQFMAKKKCFETVVKHEVGHVTGLGHSNKSNALMAPSVDQASCNAGKPLGPDDKKFYKKLYNKKFARVAASDR